MNATTTLFRSGASNARRLLTILGLAALGSILPAAKAQLSLPIYEPFPASYTNSGAGAEAPVGSGTFYPSQGFTAAANNIQTVWSLNPGTGTGNTLIIGGPAILSYLNLATNVTPTVGLYIRTNAVSGNRTKGLLFNAVSNNSVYASCLFKVDQFPDPASTSPRIFALFSTNGTGVPSSTGVGAAVGFNASSNVVVSMRSFTTAAATNDALLSPGTHMVVMRYTFDPVDKDPVAVWLDPQSSEFGASEDSLPTPTLLVTNTTDQPWLQSFYIYHPSSGPVPVNMFIDEVRVGTNWAQVTPTGVVCNSATVTKDPTNATVAAGVPARLSIQASGSAATYQWQFKTLAGGVWTNVTNGLGANSLVYTTLPLFTNDNQTQYRAIVYADCGSGSWATSAVATVTVTNPPPAPAGIVMDDTWEDLSRNNTDVPMGSSNSLWWASVTANLTASSGDMVGIPSSGSALWVGYFTSNEPTRVAIGQSIKATLAFTANNVVSNGGNSLRIGLYDYSDMGGRLTADGTGGSGGNATNVMGYMLILNFGTNFGTDTPLALYVRTNYDATDLMGTSANFKALGVGPTNMTLNGSQAFVSGVPYLVELSVTPVSDAVSTFSVNVSGNGTNWSHSVTESTYGYRRFDTLAVRPSAIAATADSFNFTEFKLELLDSAPTAIPLNIVRSGSDVILSWSNPVFALQAAPDVTGTFTNVSGATSPHTNAISGTRTFFRLRAN